MLYQSCWNNLVTGLIVHQTCYKLSTTCSKLVPTNSEQTVRIHLADKLLQQHCYKSAAGLFQLARIYACAKTWRLLQLLHAAPQDNLAFREAFGNVNMAWNILWDRMRYDLEWLKTRFLYHIRILSLGIKCGYDLEWLEKRFLYHIRILSFGIKCGYDLESTFHKNLLYPSVRPSVRPYVRP